MSLTTRALRLVLKNPLIASASPLAGEIDDLRRLEDAGLPPSCGRPSSRSKSKPKEILRRPV
jgi:hypothetical protein